MTIDDVDVAVARHIAEATILPPWAAALPIDAPFYYANISQTMLSVALHYGGATVNGYHYVYAPDADALIRSDVLNLVRKRRKELDKLMPEPAAPLTSDLFEDI